MDKIRQNSFLNSIQQMNINSCDKQTITRQPAAGLIVISEAEEASLHPPPVQNVLWCGTTGQKFFYIKSWIKIVASCKISWQILSLDSSFSNFSCLTCFRCARRGIGFLRTLANLGILTFQPSNLSESCLNPIMIVSYS